MRSFYDFIIAIGEEAYLDGMSTAYVVREGLDVDEELDLSDLGDVDADGDAVIPEPVPENLTDKPEEPSHQSIGDREREWLAAARSTEDGSVAASRMAEASATGPRSYS